MEFNTQEQIAFAAAVQKCDDLLVLNELELALVGGGCGEVIIK